MPISCHYHPANFMAYAFSSLKNGNDEKMRMVEEQRDKR